MPFAEYEDVVEAVASDRSNSPLRVCVLQWRPTCRGPISAAYCGEVGEGLAGRAHSIAHQFPTDIDDLLGDCE